MRNRITFLIARIIFCFLRMNPKKLIFIDYAPGSGSNVKVLYDFMTKEYNDLDLIYINFQKILEKPIGNAMHLGTGAIVITSHGPIKKMKKKQKFIELWHGIPLKKMGLLENETTMNKKKIDTLDRVISSSETYTTLLNACIGINNKYVITGFPRNDLLNLSGGETRDIILKYFSVSENDKLMVFMPTFRKGYIREESDLNREYNIFGLGDMNIDEFNAYLVKNRITVIVKLHPKEEVYYKKALEGFSNIKLCTSEFLAKYNLDIYQILSETDLLITDYSSVYFDYLLLDKPILFLNTDLDQYRNNRGFLLNPFEFWTPGPKVNVYNHFICELEKLLTDEKYYKTERENIKKIVHEYTDFKYSERVAKYIYSNYLN
ncbi:CDP-glycerol glycerophosphotransferase family protein [Bacillus paramycoides]|uniref:CDP-glycerol glycerophosphotransferase family protein n=1 Tax=Bacillus paramycoides TaxID=2026194 RepID=UPI00318412AD